MIGKIICVVLLGFVLVQSDPLWRRGKRSSSDEDASLSDDGMTSQRSLNTLDIGAGNNSVTLENPSVKNASNQKQCEVKNNTLVGMKSPILKNETCVIDRSLVEIDVPGEGSNAPSFEPESSASFETKGNSWLSLGPGDRKKYENAMALGTLSLERRPTSRSRECSPCSSSLSLALGSRCSSVANNAIPGSSQRTPGHFLCKICLDDVSYSKMFKIEGCECFYCKDCIKNYVESDIGEGAYEISCPDAQCNRTSLLSLDEIASLVIPELMEKYHKFRLERNVSMDGARVWCPRADCETICSAPSDNTEPIYCPKCVTEFCSICREPWRNGSCLNRHLDMLSDHIKYCPKCSVPIEMNGGCAEIQCKICKHIFCWFCLAPLREAMCYIRSAIEIAKNSQAKSISRIDLKFVFDLFLEHYRKGPCKGKLGHSRAFIVFYRCLAVFTYFGGPLILILRILRMAGYFVIKDE